jgi:aryl-alcohol dehydrogenase-like predicted oxidoreductase
MQYVHLGRTGLNVSRLCLGTMNLGNRTDEPDSLAVLDAALEAGINFIDTADGYGRPRGTTERIIGGWLTGGGRRDRIVLATKVYATMGRGPNDRGLSAYHIRRACEESLRRLKTDHIDLYQMHHVDRATPCEEIWQAMEQLIAAGKITYVGSSNFPGWQIATANQTAARRHLLGLVSEQSKYSLADRMIELEVIPACREYGLGLIPWSPLSEGLLAGLLDKPAGSSRRQARRRAQAERDRLEAYEAFCRQVGRHPAQVALAWLLSRPAVTAPILGPRTVDHLHTALGALEVSLDDQALARLEEIWPGPGGEAPEAYSW